MAKRSPKAAPAATSGDPAAAVPRSPSPEEVRLEARLVDDPDDLEVWQVYGDLLQKRGDPHGELVALQIAADKDPPGKKTPARAAFVRAFAKHAKVLVGSLARHGASQSDPYAPPFQWRTGFLRKAALVPPTEAGKPRVPVVLAELLAHPAARLLGELSIQVATSADLDAVLDVLAARPPPLLAELDLVSREHATDLAVLWKTFPRLRRLAIVAHAIELDGIELIEARRISLQALTVSASAMRALAAAPWPALERLELRVGSRDSEARATVGHDTPEHRIVAATYEDIAPLLLRTDLPKLTHLRVRNAPFAGAILRELATSPLGRQLEVLDLSKGTLTPRDIEYASERRAGFANLRELWVPALTQWSGVADALALIAKHVVTRAPLDVFER